MSKAILAMRHQPSPPKNTLSNKLDGLALDQLSRTARTQSGWTDRPVTAERLRELYDLMKFGPTSGNSCPARCVCDLDFPEQLPKLFPARGKAMRAFYSDPLIAQSIALRNGSLQGAYLITAARGLGLDCGPVSGFSDGAVDSEFFANTRIKFNFICSIGYGSNENLFPRNPRLTFEGAGRSA